MRHVWWAPGFEGTLSGGAALHEQWGRSWTGKMASVSEDGRGLWGRRVLACSFCRESYTHRTTTGRNRGASSVCPGLLHQKCAFSFFLSSNSQHARLVPGPLSCELSLPRVRNQPMFHGSVFLPSSTFASVPVDGCIWWWEMAESEEVRDRIRLLWHMTSFFLRWELVILVCLIFP